MSCARNPRRKRLSRRPPDRLLSDLRKEVEEGINALPELRLDLLARAFKQVQRYPRRVAVFEIDGTLSHPGHFFGREQAQTINKSQICHMDHLIPAGSVRHSQGSGYNRKGIPHIVI